MKPERKLVEFFNDLYFVGMSIIGSFVTQALERPAKGKSYAINQVRFYICRVLDYFSMPIHLVIEINQGPYYVKVFHSTVSSIKLEQLFLVVAQLSNDIQA